MHKRSIHILFLLLAGTLGVTGCSYFNKKPITHHNAAAAKKAAEDAEHRDMTTKAIIDGTMGK